MVVPLSGQAPAAIVHAGSRIRLGRALIAAKAGIATHQPAARSGRCRAAAAHAGAEALDTPRRSEGGLRRAPAPALINCLPASTRDRARTRCAAIRPGCRNRGGPPRIPDARPGRHNRPARWSRCGLMVSLRCLHDRCHGGTRGKAEADHNQQRNARSGEKTQNTPPNTTSTASYHRLHRLQHLLPVRHPRAGGSEPHRETRGSSVRSGEAPITIRPT